MKWDECPRQEFRDRSPGRKLLELISNSVFDDENPGEGGVLSHGNIRLTMPGCTENLDFTGDVSDDDPVIRKDLHALPLPQSSQGALAGPGMSCEDPASSKFVDDPACVQFDTETLPEAVNHQQFIQRVFQRVRRLLTGPWFLKNDCPGGIRMVGSKFLVRNRTSMIAEEAKDSFLTVSVQPPDHAGIKYQGSRSRTPKSSPLQLKSYVGCTLLIGKFFPGRIRRFERVIRFYP